MSNLFSKTVASTAFVALILAITLVSIKVFGVWNQIHIFKLILTGAIGFATYFFFFNYLITKLGARIQTLILPKIIIWILRLMALIFLILGALTGFLMLRTGSYQSSEILRVTSVYISMAVYGVGGGIGSLQKS